MGRNTIQYAVCLIPSAKVREGHMSGMGVHVVP